MFEHLGYSTYVSILIIHSDVESSFWLKQLGPWQVMRLERQERAKPLGVMWRSLDSILKTKRSMLWEILNQRIAQVDLWLRKITLTDVWDSVWSKLETGRIVKRLLMKATQDILRGFIKIVAVGMEEMGLNDIKEVNLWESRIQDWCLHPGVGNWVDCDTVYWGKEYRWVEFESQTKKDGKFHF